ncbi:FecR domain-containing protein [Alloalcanivorax sp. C16-1]|uniref:FecR domain-containing protein n=1 Tax=Alloalcanivorax sp. C16-1 TaxID=3390051 RepID=UPI0039710918
MSAPLGDGVLEEAANWFAVLHAETVNDADRRAWRSWLAGDPRHRRAWAAVEAIDRDFHGLSAGPARAALNAAGRRRRHLLLGLAALAAGGPAVWHGWRSPQARAWRAEYRTAVGERRAWTLAGGTRLWLDTDSALNRRDDPGRRVLELVHGEISVATGHDDPRPLVVRTVAGTVQPLGTRFLVADRGAQVTVRVLEGRVRITPLAGEARLLAAGEEAGFNATGVDAGRPLRGEPAAWTEGRLVADGQRLDRFLARLARHRHGVLRCQPEVAGLRLVGAFPLNDTDAVLRALAETLPLRVDYLTPWWVTVGPR